MMRALAATILVIVSISIPAISQPQTDRIIVPGERIGKWALPITIDGLLQMNGPKSAVGGGPLVFELTYSDQQATKMWVHRWDHLGLRAVTIGSPDAQEVFNLTIGVLFNPSNRMDDYRTEKGVGLSVSREVVEGAYGKPTAVTRAAPDVSHLIYDGLGLAVGIFTDGRVGSVIVFRKGTAKQRWRY